MNKRTKQIIAMLAICLMVYNIAVFIISGFTDHTACFWLSYLFMMVSIATSIVSAVLLMKQNREIKDWLFGYPVLKHCFAYILIEFICSVIFMILDNYDCDWKIGFVIQLIICAVFTIFIISCFMTKDTIEQVEANVKASISFMKGLQVDVELIAAKADNEEVRKAYSKLAENIKYSDPVSMEALKDVENRIAEMVKSGEEAVVSGNSEAAIECCKNAELLLMERNKKCKALK